MIPEIIPGRGPRATRRLTGCLYGKGTVAEHIDPQPMAPWDDFTPGPGPDPSPGRSPHRVRRPDPDRYPVGRHRPPRPRHPSRPTRSPRDRNRLRAPVIEAGRRHGSQASHRQGALQRQAPGPGLHVPRDPARRGERAVGRTWRSTRPAPAHRPGRGAGQLDRAAGVFERATRSRIAAARARAVAVRRSVQEIGLFGCCFLLPVLTGAVPVRTRPR